MVDTVLSMRKSFLRDASAPLYLMMLRASSVTDIEGITRLGRGGSPPEVATEPILGFEDVRATIEGVASSGIHGEQVAKAKLG